MSLVVGMLVERSISLVTYIENRITETLKWPAACMQAKPGQPTKANMKRIAVFEMSEYRMMFWKSWRDHKPRLEAVNEWTRPVSVNSATETTVANSKVKHLCTTVLHGR